MLLPLRSRLPSRIRVAEWANADSAAEWDREQGGKGHVLRVAKYSSSYIQKRALKHIICYILRMRPYKQHHRSATHHIPAAQSPPMPMSCRTSHLPNHSLHAQTFQETTQVLLLHLDNAMLETIQSHSRTRLLHDLLKCVAKPVPA